VTDLHRVDIERNSEKSVMAALVPLGRGDRTGDGRGMHLAEPLSKEQRSGSLVDLLQRHPYGIVRHHFDPVRRKPRCRSTGQTSIG
jgi:hypothetical protein